MTEIPFLSDPTCASGWLFFSSPSRLFSRSALAELPHSPLEECTRIAVDAMQNLVCHEPKVFECLDRNKPNEIVNLIKQIAEPLFLEIYEKLSKEPKARIASCELPDEWLFVINAVDPAYYPRLSDYRDSRIDVSIQTAVLAMSNIEITKLETGSTNHVFHLHHAKLKNKHLLLRVYGSCDGVGDRGREEIAMKCMSSCGLGPKLLIRFPWGRIEEFIDGAVTCTTEMLISSPIFQLKIYNQLRAMHKLPFFEFLPQVISRYSPEGVSLSSTHEEYFKECQAHISHLLGDPSKTDSYYHFGLGVKAMEEICSTSLERTCLRFLRYLASHVIETHELDLEKAFLSEIRWLHLNLRNSGSPIVFSHNDLNPGNILFKGDPNSALQSESCLFFLDYEYSDANYRAFDLGNGMCELDYSYDSRCKGGFCKPLYTLSKEDNLPREYPRLSRAFYECWRAKTKGILIHSKGPLCSLASRCVAAIEVYFFGTCEGALTELHLREVFLGMLSSHLVYSLWSFLMGVSQRSPEKDGSCTVKNGLDYMDYGECRIKEYFLLKNWILETREINLSDTNTC